MNTFYFLVKADTSALNCSSAFASVNLLRRPSGRIVDPDYGE